MDQIASRSASWTLVCWSVFVVSILSGCDKPTALDRRTCKSVVEWLNLSEEDNERCLKDESARKSWVQERNIKLAKALTASFNKQLSIIEPRGHEKEIFSNVASVNDLPHGLGLGEEAEKNLGKRYQVNARVGWSDPDEPDSEPTVWVYDLSDREEHGSYASRMADAHFLNDYQKKFLEEHCWHSYLSEGSSLCVGKVFLAMERSPKAPFVELEFVGAIFRKTEEETVIESFKR